MPLPTVSSSVAAVGVQVVGMLNFTSRSLTGALASTLILLVVGVAVAGSMVASSVGVRVMVVPPAAVLTWRCCSGPTGCRPRRWP